MGKGCDPKNLVATTRAAGQVTGDIFTEAERLKNFDGEQHFWYEKFMSDTFGVNLKKPETLSVYDALKKAGVKHKDPHFLSARQWGRPSAAFSKKFYGAIDRKLTAWEKGADKSSKSYRDNVVKPTKTLIEAIDQAIVDSKGNKLKLTKGLTRFSLDADTVYDAKKYLEWIADGGHTQKSKFLQPVLDAAGNVSKAQANLNLLWTAGNGVDMIRVYSHYLTQPGSVKNIVNGTVEALKASNGNLFKRIPSLEKAGVYKSEHMDRGGGNLNPFEWSITAQKNLAYHLDKAAGGDGVTGVKDQLFDYKPWDQPRSYRFAENNLAFGLARYSISETGWYFKTAREALSGDKRAAANLAVFTMARAVVVGPQAAVLPAWVYTKLPDEWKKGIRDFEDQTGLNVVRHFSGAVLNKLGINAEFDLGSYVAPLGGQFGARAQSLVQTAERSGGSVAKAVVNISQGKLPAAAADSLAALSAMTNLVGTFGKLKALDPVNSTTVTKLLETMGEELAGKYTDGKFPREILKDLFGTGEVKKTDDNPSAGLPELPMVEGL